MAALINLMISTLNSLVLAFGSMNISSTLNLFTLLLITGVVLAIVDIVGRLSR